MRRSLHMKKDRLIRQRMTVGILIGVLILLFVCGGAVVAGAQENQQEVALEKSAVWESPVDYRATVNLKVSGIEKYTQKEVPISVIPLLDVTGSMEHCETLGHHHDIFSHPFTSFLNAAEIWKNEIAPTLPDPDSYCQMGQVSADQMFLHFPQEVDPLGRCRLVYLKNEQNQKAYYEMTNWRVFYVTDDDTPLYPIKEGHGIYSYGHTVFQDGAYLPVGTAQQAQSCLAWRYTGDKEPGHGCVASRMDQLKDGYAQFVQALFENSGARICPVAFVGGYYINGWTDDPQEAIDFLGREEYLQKEQVLPDYNYGTNYEAALAGAMDAVGRLEEYENTFAILFTDGEATSGYDHASGKADLSCLDPHSFYMPDQDESWYPIYGQWAVEDAQALKKLVSVYSVGYGYTLDTDGSMQILQMISSGEDYFIDSRSTSIQTVTDIFRAIYSDMIYKATKAHIVDYISEFWEVERDKLPNECKIEEIPIVNQEGQPDVIYKLTYPITKEMGAGGHAEIQIPVVLREKYRQVQEKTLYETNQDAPFLKDQEGPGAYVEYMNLEGEEQRVFAETPRLDVYPEQPDFILEKRALESPVRAGETVSYEFRLVNCGQAVLNSIHLKDVFGNKNVTLTFDATEGTSLQEKDSLIVDNLGLGEEKIVTGSAKIPEDLQGNIENVVTATVANPRELEKKIEKTAKAAVEIVPLDMNFEVEKTVDRAQVAPGETLTYEIRIANTGDRELCSVVATDKFLKANIQARFQKQAHVSLRKGGTQAWIESILPGEEVVLTATARIPFNFTEEELINTVLVSLDGQEGKEKSAEASATVKKKLPGTSVSGNMNHPLTEKKKASATEEPKNSSQQGNRTAAATPRASYTSTGAGTDGRGVAASTSPKTEDNAPLAPLLLLLGIAGIGVVTLLCIRFCPKKRQE